MVGDLIRSLFRSRTAVIAESLFLRRQLALFQKRKTRRSRPTPATKLALVALSRFFPWASALAIVKPDTSSAGTELDFTYSGATSLATAVVPRCLRTCAHW
jgi:hypothetical protein